MERQQLTVLVTSLCAHGLWQIRGLKELLSIREGALKDYQSAWQRQDKLEFEQKTWVDKGRQDKAEKCEPQIAAVSRGLHACLATAAAPPPFPCRTRPRYPPSRRALPAAVQRTFGVRLRNW